MQSKKRTSVAEDFPERSVFSDSLSSFNNSSTDEISSKKCFVCQKSFILRRKFTCQICLNVFCSDHCSKKRRIHSDEDMVNVCDMCDEEEMKKEIAVEISREIEKVSKELLEIREENERLFKEQFNNTGSLNNIDMEIKKQEWNAKKEENDLQGILESEQNKGQKMRKQIDEMRKVLDESNLAERLMSDQCVEAEFEADSLKIEVRTLQDQKEEIMAQLEKITSTLRESLSLDQIRKILCEKCLFLVNANLKADFSDPDILQSVKEYHRQSLIDYENPKKECGIS